MGVLVYKHCLSLPDDAVSPVDSHQVDHHHNPQPTTLYFLLVASSGRINLLNRRVTAAMDPCVPPKASSAGVPSASTSGIVPAVPPNAPGAASAGSGATVAASWAGAEVSVELSEGLSEELSDEVSEEELSSDDVELLEPDDSSELLPEGCDDAGIVVKPATELDAALAELAVAVTELAELTAAADVLEATALVAAAEVAAADVADKTEVVVPLPAPALPLPAETMTKSTQLSYVCLAAVPNQNHCSTHSPATLQSLAARLVGMVTAKLVLFAGRTLSFSSA